MSNYRIGVTVKGVNGNPELGEPTKVVTAFQGVIDERPDGWWSIDDWWDEDGNMVLVTALDLGMTLQKHLADIVSQTIWEALGRYVHITVEATLIQKAPCAVHIRDLEDYNRMMPAEITTENND